MFLLPEYLLRVWREHTARAVDEADLGVRITYLPSEAGHFAVEFNGRSRG